MSLVNKVLSWVSQDSVFPFLFVSPTTLPHTKVFCFL